MTFHRHGKPNTTLHAIRNLTKEDGQMVRILCSVELHNTHAMMGHLQKGVSGNNFMFSFIVAGWDFYYHCLCKIYYSFFCSPVESHDKRLVN